MLGWKMVDVQHADAVAAGSVRIGTFSSFKDLENGRADPNDGGIVITAPLLLPGFPGHDFAMDRLGLDNASLIRNCTFSYSVAPLFVFCLSRQSCTFDWTPDQPKAIFEIKDMKSFAERLRVLYPRKLGKIKAASVRYINRKYNALDPVILPPDAFLKDSYFSREEEIRIVWTPRTQELIEPFVTQPDEILANLIRRIN